MTASQTDSRLKWSTELGLGWFPVEDQPYDAGYWHRYRALDRTVTGAALTDMRRMIVREWTQEDEVVDIGIGGGRFVEESGSFGFDVNPLAIAWLKSRGAWLDPYAERVPAACFWDSLEHIHSPGALLRNVYGFAFVSCPIFTDEAHARRSKHFRPTEHGWYFTEHGIRQFMAAVEVQADFWRARSDRKNTLVPVATR